MLKNSGYSRTDLACESQAVNGAGKRREYRRGEFVCSELIISKDEEAYFEKKAGRYVTMSPGKLWLWDDEKAESFAGALADELIRFTEEAISGEITPETSVLVCGLGNRFITADALGPQTLDKLTVTRHMMGNGSIFDQLGCSSIAAVAPGTLGQTGIEAQRLLSGAVAEAKPDAVIVIDALAAKSTERLCRTVQLSDSGIRPGSGIGNSRSEISRESIGVPVISVGVPTVVDSSTLVCDVLEQAGFDEVSDEITQILESGRDFFVSPKECDIITDSLSAILASAIEKAFGL